MNRHVLVASACAALAVTFALPAGSQTAPKAAPAPKPAAKGGVSVAAGDVNGDGQALLLPAVQKVREAAARNRASDALLKFEPIKGEAAKADDNHKEWIEISSWSLGATNTAACSGSSGAGTLTLSGASLNPAAAKIPRTAVLEVKPARGQVDPLTDGLLIVRFINLVPASAQPAEQVALNYSKVSWTRAPCKGAAPSGR